MSRKPATIEIIDEGDARYLLLTYADGEVVKQRVETGGKARRRPRRPQTRLKLADRNNDDG